MGPTRPDSSGPFQSNNRDTPFRPPYPHADSRAHMRWSEPIACRPPLVLVDPLSLPHWASRDHWRIPRRSVHRSPHSVATSPASAVHDLEEPHLGRPFDDSGEGLL